MDMVHNVFYVKTASTKECVHSMLSFGQGKGAIDMLVLQEE